MSWQATRLNLAFATVAGCALFLGVVAGRPDLVVAAVPLVVALVAARLARAPSGWRLSHDVSAERVFEDDRVTVSVRLTAGTAMPLVELSLPLPPLVGVLRGGDRTCLALGAGEEARWSVELACPARRRLLLPGVRVRVWEPLGLRALEADHADPRTVAVYPRAAPLPVLPRPRRPRTHAGHHVSPAQGEGIEPAEIRPFVAGDQVRHVNWPATLRRGELHVTRHHRERSADVVLLLDTLAAPGPAGATTLDLAARAAASLAAACLARKDRVGLVEYGGLLRWVRPGSGRVQLHRLMEALLQASVVFSYVSRDLDLIPPRVLPPRALVIALSPLLDARFATAVVHLAARGFDLEVVAVCPVGPARAAVRPSRAADAAARLWALERRAQLDALRGRGLSIVEWDGATPLAAALAALRRPRHLRGAAG